MKLLLLNRVKNIDLLSNEYSIEYFGPWAQTIDSPDDIEKPEFEPYSDPKNILGAATRSLETANNILDTLSIEMPKITGVEMESKFWRFMLGHYVINLCGLVEDVSVRLNSLPLNRSEYILGIGEINKFRPLITNDFINLHDENFRMFLMLLCIKPYFQQHQIVEYQPVTPYDLSSTQGYLSTLLRKAAKVKRFIYDSLHNINMIYFSNIDPDTLLNDRYNNDLRFAANNLIYGMSEYNLTSNNIYYHSDVNIKKRKILEKNLPEPYGYLISNILPLSLVENFHSIFYNIKSESKKFNAINRIYTHGQAFSSPVKRNRSKQPVLP